MSATLEQNDSRTTHGYRAIGPFANSDNWFYFVATAMASLPILTFTIPGYPSPSSQSMFDWLALVKLGILVGTFGIGLLILYSHREQTNGPSAARPMLLFFLFLGWAIASVAWTPSKAVTIGKAGELSALLVLCSVIALLAQKQTRVSEMTRWLCYTLTTFSAFVLVVFAINPEVSGITRDMIHHGGDGMVHPTAVGATASLGILLCVTSWVVMRYPWAKRATLFGLAANVPALLLSQSRTALAMCVLTVGLVFLIFGSRKGLAAACITLSVILVVYVLVDPGFSLVSDSAGAGVEYLSRGQNMQEIQQGSGRMEMWAAIWKNYKGAEILGHGYFVTSASGSFYVWQHVANHDAHNVLLQVLVTTGIVGLMLFLLAMGKLIISVAALRRGDLFSRRLLWLLVLFAVWFAGWSLGSTSFMGPLRPESIVFFALIGLALGDRSRLAATETGDTTTASQS